MLGLTDKDIHTLIISIFNLFKKLSKDMEEIKKTQNAFLEMKTTILEI